MNLFITYSDDTYAPAKRLCARMAKWAGRFDRVIAYGPADIDEAFRKAHAETFAIRRGAGLWLWKPYILLKTLTERAQDGDVVFYADAGAFFIRPFRHILQTMKQDIWVSHIPLAEKQYTKRETFVLMKCEGAAYEETPQAQGGFVGIRKSAQSVAFVKEWLTYACNYRILSATPNPLYPEREDFQAHREDQSILSLLCKKHHIATHPDPTQYALFPEKLSRPGNRLLPLPLQREYPVMLILHRQPRIAFKSILFQSLHVILPRRIVRLFLSKAYHS